MSALSERFMVNVPLWKLLLTKLKEGPQRYTDLELYARQNDFSTAKVRKALRDLKAQGYIHQKKERARYEITPSGLLWLRSIPRHITRK